MFGLIFRIQALRRHVYFDVREVLVDLNGALARGAPAKYISDGVSRLKSVLVEKTLEFHQVKSLV